LLISVGILIFNSSSGTTNNAGAAGDAMEIAAISERARIILETSDIKDNGEFNNFIRKKYGHWRMLNKEEIIELCELVKLWAIKATGSNGHTHEVTHITCNSSKEDYIVYQLDNGQVNYSRLENDKKYRLDDWLFDNYVIEPNIVTISIIK